MAANRRIFVSPVYELLKRNHTDLDYNSATEVKLCLNNVVCFIVQQGCSQVIVDYLESFETRTEDETIINLQLIELSAWQGKRSALSECFLTTFFLLNRKP